MNKRIIAVTAIFCFTFSVLFFLHTMKGDGQTSGKIDPQQLGKFCIAQIYPAVGGDTASDADDGSEASMEVTETVVKKTEKTEKKTEVDNSKPQVIIYHTHSSESYQPYTDSNFHRQEEAGTVREVGNVLTEELNELGISVVHDKTIHDSPSYNESYTRSMETITALLKKYPTAEVVIDLHRDAAAYTGNVGETMTIDGETVAKYKLVIGQANDNYAQLKAFADEINDAADKLYPGFSGTVIEKEYRYNEYIADKYLLLEVGNNQNDIKEVRKTGKYFAHVLAEVLEEE